MPCDDNLQTKIINTQKAANSFVCMATIATGILTIIAFSHNSVIWNRYPGWLRTRRTVIPTVAIVKETLIQEFHALWACSYSLPFVSFILPLRRVDDFLYQEAA